MKTSTIETMVRSEHSIPEDLPVKVQFMGKDGATSEYKITWHTVEKTIVQRIRLAENTPTVTERSL